MRWICLWVLVLSSPALAADLRSGDELVVPRGEVIEDDLYVAGSTVRIEGEVRGDVIAAARDLEVLGRIQGDLVGAANHMRVTGSVGGTIRVAASELALGGPVAKDVVAAGNEIRLEPGAVVRGDVIAAGDKMSIRGPISGTLRAAGRKLDLDARVGGDARVRAESLTVGSQTEVGGLLSYAAQQASLAEEARFGSVERQPVPRRLPTALGFLLGWLRLSVGLFGLGLGLRLVAPRLSGEALASLRRRPGMSAASGALTLVAVPLLAVLLFVLGALIGGWWLGLIALVALAIAITLAFPLVGLHAGEWAVRHLGASRARLV
ncbi:MAG: hypothetical protein HY901_29530, partial [Deltaproteobacteria bacterium]|nr:hypothetical protein [Deltaproteobacteria bacterium]